MKRQTSVISESLEPRRLLAGVTILMHGYNGNITGWVASAADAIAHRTNGSASVYTMTVAKDSSGHLAVTGYNLSSGPALNKNTSGEVIVKLDWSSVDDGSYSTVDVGKVVADYLVSRHGSDRALAELPIHLVGHSRGASVAVVISAQLAQRGIWVDQETFLDPHPVDGHNDFLNADFGDSPMRVYDNVAFADNYWRTDGNSQNFDPDGEAVTGTHQGDLNNTVQKDFIISAHMAVTAYYHGTIDLNSVFNGDHPVLNAWYDHSATKPPRNGTGFYFSQIGGGRRPLDGIGTPFGGSGARVSVDPVGSQWPNVMSVSSANGSTFASGNRIRIRVQPQDHNSSSNFTIFLDKDQNPYNGNNIKTMRRTVVNNQQTIRGIRISARTNDVPAGKYYIGVQTRDADGYLRFAYSSQVTVTPGTSSVARAASTSASGAIVQSAIVPQGVFSSMPISTFARHATGNAIDQIVALA